MPERASAQWLGRVPAPPACGLNGITVGRWRLAETTLAKAVPAGMKSGVAVLPTGNCSRTVIIVESDGYSGRLQSVAGLVDLLQIFLIFEQAKTHSVIGFKKKRLAHEEAINECRLYGRT
jgi:hypothetical protein